MATARTAAAAGATTEVVSIRVVEPTEEDEVYELYAQLGQMHRLSTLIDNIATALRKQMIDALKKEGLDGSRSGLRGIFGESSDAVRTADRAVKPLRAIAADLENAAKNAHVGKSRAEQAVFDAIRAAIRERERSKQGLKVNR